jgi:FkbM family methyltransferase
MMITRQNAFLLSRRTTALEKLFKATFLRSKAVLNDGQAELGMLQSLIPKGSTTIDVGANVGDFARRLSELSSGGLVIAIEPQSMPRSVMTMAGFFKRSSGIFVVPVALGDRQGLTELTVPIKSKGNVGIGLAHIGDDRDLAARFEIKKELVALTTLDCVVAEIDVGHISFIKIDVEGGELAVLRGAVKTIDQHRPSILCEIDSREGRFSATQRELIEYFQERHYTPRRVSDLSVLDFSALEKNTVFTPDSVRREVAV